MRLITVLTLWVLLFADVAAQESPRAGAPRPEACAGFKIAGSSRAAERDPYPQTRKPWAVDVSSATIVKDPLVARIFAGRFEPLSIEQIRERLTKYFVLTRTEWLHGYSHAGGGDEGGWLVAGGECYLWTIRPGGLGWIVYPDGTAVHLAAELHRPL